MQSDNYVDRLHHNTIWLQLPDELPRLPADADQLMFLAVSEGQGCCHWHLLLAPDNSRRVVCAEAAFGLRSVWLSNNVPDFSRYEVSQCANSFDEWLDHYFCDSAEHDRQYAQRLEDYFRGTA